MKLLTSRSLVQNQISRESKFLTKEATEVCLNGWKARNSFSQKSVPAGQPGPRGKGVAPDDTWGAERPPWGRWSFWLHSLQEPASLPSGRVTPPLWALDGSPGQRIQVGSTQSIWGALGFPGNLL